MLFIELEFSPKKTNELVGIALYRQSDSYCLARYRNESPGGKKVILHTNLVEDGMPEGSKQNDKLMKDFVKSVANAIVIGDSGI